jgi:GNAT superfamily N-acetyltransferase
MALPDDVTLEPADVDDAGELLTLQRAAYVTEAQLHGDLALPPLVQSLDELRDELSWSTAWKIVTRAGRIVAGVRVVVDAGTAHVNRVAVAPDWQGRGLGTALIEHVHATLPATVTQTELFTGSRSLANLRLYERLGYTEFDRTPLPTGYELVRMQRPRGTASDPGTGDDTATG